MWRSGCIFIHVEICVSLDFFYKTTFVTLYVSALLLTVKKHVLCLFSRIFTTFYLEIQDISVVPIAFH
jgi:hypothetical protein